MSTFEIRSVPTTFFLYFMKGEGKGFPRFFFLIRG